MSECVCLPKCPFFNDRMANMPAMANKIKDKYCKGDHSNCARFLVFKALGPGKAPDTLFPAQVEMAQAVIAAAR